MLHAGAAGEHQADSSENSEESGPIAVAGDRL